MTAAQPERPQRPAEIVVGRPVTPGDERVTFRGETLLCLLLARKVHDIKKRF
jgi:hypothetical protein